MLKGIPLLFFFALPCGGGEGGSPNLAWELIQGFVRVWNQTDQGICIALPPSMKEGLRFFVTPLNVTYDLAENQTTQRGFTLFPATWSYNGTHAVWGADYLLTEGYPEMISRPSFNGTLRANDTYFAFYNSSDSDFWGRSTCSASHPEMNFTFTSKPKVADLPRFRGGNATILPGMHRIEAAGPYSLSCSNFPFDPHFHPLKQPDYYEADFSLNVTLSWCVQLPNGTGTEPINNSNIEWMWSHKKPDLEPLRYVIPPRHSSSPLFSCGKILNCSTGPGDPPLTWLVAGVRALIRDMCLCWGYPSYGFKNQDPHCKGVYNFTNNADRRRGRYCGVPYTHYPLKGVPISARPEIYLVNYTDTWTCQSSIYPAPFGLAWGCSNGKFYSYLNPHDHAGLQCGIVLPSLCS
ncbi:uncharacterized protein J5F26_010847 [Ciconia maguari]